MSPAASVEGDERLRLFCGLRLPDDLLDAIVAWQATNLAGRVPGGRVVPRQNLHVTLAFLGTRPAGEVPAVVEELRAAAAAAGRLRLSVVRWRETRSVGMLVLDDEGGAATRLAEDLQERLERLGVYRREGRPWLPHLTLLRFRDRPRLAVESAGLWEQFGEIMPSDAAAYLSRLRPQSSGDRGAQYEVLESVPLSG